MMCAFVPPTPSEFTEARRGVFPAGQGRSLSFTKNGLCSNSICGLGRS
jgi:hypothetical protein